MSVFLEPFTHQSQPIGHIFNGKDVVIFFGNRYASLPLLRSIFSSIQLISIKQIHSSLWVSQNEPMGKSSKEPLFEADAHFTNKNNLALVIQTADCLPILIHKENTIAAVHAGWRGLINGILLETTQRSFLADAKFYVGPHIQKKSFEVRQDALGPIKWMGQQLSLNEETYLTPHSYDSTKAYVDLAYLLKAQIQFLGGKLIHTSSVDTFTHADYFSYRREGPSAGRQYSLIWRRKN